MPRHEHIKEYLFLLVIIIFLLPQAQNYFGFITPRALKGSFDKQENPKFSFNSWISSKYQDEKTKYINDNFGLRNTLVRLNNQINYSLFHTSNAYDIVIGKENYLYEEKYILGYLGRDFVGEKTLRNQITKLKKIQDTLSRLDIKLFYILAAGKASFFPEFIPDKYKPNEKDVSNYNILKREMNVQGINHIDFNKWFIEMKDTSSHKLFPKGGIHWSKYGEYLAADSIIKYVEQKWNYKLPELILDSITISNTMRSTDDDLEQNMNLFTNLPDFTMTYPHFHFNINTDIKRPKLLCIADSYYWGLYSYKLSRDVFNNGEFWFYNHQIYSESITENKYVKNLNYQQEIENFDIILILSTETNFSNFDFRFIDKAYDIYFGENKSTQAFENRLEYYTKQIKNSPNWLALIKEKSKKTGKTLEETIRKDAIYMIKNEKKE